jgi:hypothetical protein
LSFDHLVGLLLVSGALALPLPAAALPYALALEPTAESLPHLKIFFKNVLRQKGYPLFGAETFLDRLLREGA